MSKIEKMIAELCPNGVEWKALSEVVLPTSNIRWRDTNKSYRYIDLTSVSREQNTIIETTEITKDNAPSRAQKLVLKDDVIFATTRPVQQRLCLITEEYSDEVASTGYCVLRANTDLILPKWIFYWITSNEFKKFVEENQSGSAYPAISDAKVKEFQIPIPPLTIQKEIARILDKFTELEAELKVELEAELTARKKQYEYYRSKLLTFNEMGGVKWLILNEIGCYSNTRIDAELLNEENYVGVDNLLQNKQGKTNSSCVPEKGKLCEFLKDDILIGNIRPYLKKIWKADRTGGTNGDVLVIRINEDYKDKLTAEFLYYLLASDDFFAYNMQYAKGAKMPRGSKSAVMKFKIPIPPLAEQNHIVSILDKFDTLTTSISEGLPKEIELRKKQYEYYRDRLLTFPKNNLKAS